MLGFNGGLMGVRRTPTTSTAPGLWFQNEQSVAKRDGIWPTVAPTDPNFSSVSLLLHMDTTFTDSSSNALTVTANGNAQISTAQSKFGGASALFDGSGDYLSASANAAFGLGTDDYTIEGFFYCQFSNSDSSNYYTLFTVQNGSVFAQLRFADAGFGNRLQFNTGSTFASAFGLTLTKDDFSSSWRHIAVVRSSGAVTVYVDGISATRSTGGPEAGTTVAHDIGASAALNIGSDGAGSNVFKGYIDDIRITKSVARYTANFTPPVAPFPDA